MHFLKEINGKELKAKAVPTLKMRGSTNGNKTKLKLKKRNKTKEKMRGQGALKLDSVTWLEVKGERKERGRDRETEGWRNREGERRVGKSDQEVQWSSDEKTGKLEIQFRKLGAQEDERRIPQESAWLCEDIFVVVKFLPAESQ